MPPTSNLGLQLLTGPSGASDSGADRPCRWIALLGVSAVAAVGALAFADWIPAPAVTVGNMQGTALVLGIATLPILAASMVLVRRGFAVALILWLGALGSIAYQAVLFLFAVPSTGSSFSASRCSLSVWAMDALAGRIPVADVGARIGTGAPRRLIAGYLLLNAVLFGALWLASTAPPVVTGEPPRFLEGTEMATGPVRILDFAFTLPLMVLGAVVLWRRLWDARSPPFASPSPWRFLRGSCAPPMPSIARRGRRRNRRHDGPIAPDSPNSRSGISIHRSIHPPCRDLPRGSAGCRETAFS
jgi:hypothetical protein